MTATPPTTAPRTVGAVLAAAAERLHRAGVPTPRVDARLLVLHATGWDAARLTTSRGDVLPVGAADRLERLLERRAAREPLQLLVGGTGFRRLELEVAAGVFIPRPETEVLVGEVLGALPPGGVVAEPCTGSGAVAAAVADERPDATVLATDVDAAAVALARRNTRRWADRVAVHHGDLLAPLAGWRGRIDVLVSNPPYLATGELDATEPEVRADPLLALVAGPTGHEVSDRLLAAAPTWLAPGGTLLLELDPTRAGEVAERCRQAGLHRVDVRDDLAGRARFVRAQRA